MKAVLADKRNWSYLIAILVGFLGIFGVPQHLLQVDDQQVVIALLVFLLSSVFISQIGFLENIETQIRNLRVKLTGVDNSFIFTDEKSRKIRELLDNAHHVRLSGISFDVFLSQDFPNVVEAARRGTKFEFVMANPEAEFLGEIALHTPNEWSKQKYSDQIKNALSAFKSLDVDVRKNIEIRYTDSVLYSSVIQVSFRGQPVSQDYMAILFYAFGTPTSQALSLELERSTSPETFEFYERAENRRWEASAKNPKNKVDLT